MPGFNQLLYPAHTPGNVVVVASAAAQPSNSIFPNLKILMLAVALVIVLIATVIVICRVWCRPTNTTSIVDDDGKNTSNSNSNSDANEDNYQRNISDRQLEANRDYLKLCFNDNDGTSANDDQFLPTHNVYDTDGSYHDQMIDDTTTIHHHDNDDDTDDDTATIASDTPTVDIETVDI